MSNSEKNVSAVNMSLSKSLQPVGDRSNAKKIIPKWANTLPFTLRPRRAKQSEQPLFSTANFLLCNGSKHTHGSHARD